MFSIEGLQNWLAHRTAELRQEGRSFELSCHPEQHLQKLQVRFHGANHLASFTVWATGDCDCDIMNVATAQFVENSWGLQLTNETYKSIFEQFIVLASGSR